MEQSNDRFKEQLISFGLNADTLENVNIPEWETAEDLGKQSIDAMARKESGTSRTLPSRGSIRLHGYGVNGHSADLDAVGSIMLLFQKLVTCTGARLLGRESLRGHIPTEIVERTQMKLAAQPGFGSLVLEINPKVPGIDEAFPEGETLFGYEFPSMVLADESVNEILRLISTINVDDISGFLNEVRNIGSRSAASLKELLKQLSEGRFDVDFEWHEPDKEIKKVVLPEDTSNYAYRSIEAYKLNSFEESFVGELITVSVQKKLDLKTTIDDEETIIAIKRGELSNAVLSEFSPTNRVVIKVRATEEIKPGGDSTFVYEALDISLAP